MLIQFNFKNFKSFRDEATLDLSAAKMTEFSNRVISVGNEKILPVAAVYGANASGKSNVYGAFEYMSEYVVHSFKYGDEEKDFDDIRPLPFLFDISSENADTSFVPGAVFRIWSAGLKVSDVEWAAPETSPSASFSFTIIIP